MDLQEREKNIIAALCVVIVFCLFFFVYQPSVEKNTSLKQEVKSLKSELAKPIVTKDSVIELQEKVNEIKAEIIALNQQLPETEKRGFLIKDIEDLAKENNIEITSFIPKEAIPITMTGKEIDQRASKYRKKTNALEQRQAKVLKTVISIDANGKFSDIMSFFQDIITYYRAVEVSDLILTRAGASAKQSVDKRFGGGRSKEDPVQAARNMSLNISFTLLAFTSIPDENPVLEQVKKLNEKIPEDIKKEISKSEEKLTN
jgi:Tfp pilus assembly protein PilO